MSGSKRFFTERHKEEKDLKIVFVSRIHPIKNLLGAIRAVNALSAQIRFDIFGPIERKAYWEECEAEILNAPSNVVIEYKGALLPEKAKTIFQDYHCFLFPTYSENHGHVIAESLLCSCPVVISKGTTPWDDVDGMAGYVAELNDLSAFTERLSRIAEMDQEQYNNLIQSLSRYVDRKLRQDEVKQGYLAMFETVGNKR